MTYNVFSGTLKPTQSTINRDRRSVVSDRFIRPAVTVSGRRTNVTASYLPIIREVSQRVVTQLVAWSSGRALVFGRCSFAVLRSNCS